MPEMINEYKRLTHCFTLLFIYKNKKWIRIVPRIFFSERSDIENMQGDYYRGKVPVWRQTRIPDYVKDCFKP